MHVYHQNDKLHGYELLSSEAVLRSQNSPGDNTKSLKKLIHNTWFLQMKFETGNSGMKSKNLWC